MWKGRLDSSATLWQPKVNKAFGITLADTFSVVKKRPRKKTGVSEETTEKSDVVCFLVDKKSNGFVRTWNTIGVHKIQSTGNKI